jgi:hypothetical protein
MAHEQKRPGRPPRLTAEDMLIVSRLSSQGKSLRAIARLISTPERKVCIETIGAWLRRAKQPVEELHMALAAMRLGAVDAWDLAIQRGARDGRHAPAKDLLIATGTIRPDATDRLVVVIGNGVADAATLPALPPRSVVALPVPSEPSE